MKLLNCTGAIVCLLNKIKRKLSLLKTKEEVG